jgi:hypothetical protein
MSNTGPTLEQRLNPSVERARALMDMIFQSMRVALPAVVTSFTPGPPAMVNVQVTTNEYVERNTDETVISITSDPIALPELRDVPVMMPSAGGWSLTFPIQKGDECLIVFADTPLDIWHQNGGTNNNPISQRRHSLSDGVAIFGLRSRPRGLASYSASSAQLRNDDGSVVIDLAASKVTVTAPTVEVNSTTVEVNCSDANVTCSDEAKVVAPSVMLGSSIKLRDFLSHGHTLPAGGTTGSVV